MDFLNKPHDIIVGEPQWRWPTPVVPSAERVCRECGQAIWVSARTLAAMPGVTTFLCHPCAMKQVKGFDDVHILPATLDEIGQVLGRTITMADVKRWFEEMRQQD